MMMMMMIYVPSVFLVFSSFLCLFVSFWLTGSIADGNSPRPIKKQVVCVCKRNKWRGFLQLCPGKKKKYHKRCTSFVIRRNLDSLGRSIIIFFSLHVFCSSTIGGLFLFCLWWEMGRLDFFLFFGNRQNSTAPLISTLCRELCVCVCVSISW